MHEDTCMVETARYYLDFLAHESCGKCVPCREGLRQMLTTLNAIVGGKGEEGDIEKLEDLAELLQEASLCALGKTAAYPVLSTLRYFRAEYDAHINEKHCPARECKGLFLYEIDPEACRGCGICRKKCPVEAITGERKAAHTIDLEKCTNCGTCFDACPFSAVRKV